MNKEQFLKELEKKLKVLSENEKKDIINEYEDIINEKMKHGKTEEEAIKEFGNIDDLSKEILEAYKINPNYSNNKLLDDCEDMIKKGAQKLGEVTDNVIDSIKKDEKFNNNNVFEIIIKVLLVLATIIVLRIPFSILNFFGLRIFESTSIFNGSILRHGWNFLTEGAYFIICILILYTVVSKYMSSKNTTNNVSKKKVNNEVKKVQTEKKDTKKEKLINNNKIMNDDKKSDNSKVEKEPRKYKPSNDSLGQVIIILIKLFLFFCILLPMWIGVTGIIALICGIVWLLFKGVAIYGLLILFVGILIIGITISCLFTDLILNSKISSIKKIIINVISGIILIIFGSLFTFDYFINIDRIDDTPEIYNLTEETYVEKINQTTKVDYDNIVIDNNLENNNIKIEVSYYPEALDIKKINNNYEFCDNECKTINAIQFSINYKDIDFNNKLFHRVIDDLKNNKLYSYSQLDNYEITLYTNEFTKTLIVD